LTTIHDILETIELGNPSTFENLTMYPLLGETEKLIDYVTLDEALQDKSVSVTEVSESGTVPELLFRNAGATPVLLLDGEELIGAKQNRVLNLSILAPANGTIKIPVSCVEAGRWSHQSAEFQSSDRSMYARGRSRKSAQVSFSMKRGSRHSDQGEVWNDISEKSARMAVHSETGAMSDIFENHATKVEMYLSHFKAVGRQVGAIFEINGAVAGLDLFDKAATFEKVLPKLIRSFALDAVETSLAPENKAAKEGPEAFIDTLSASDAETFPAVGLGEDIRLESQAASGGALVADETTVHFYAFPMLVEQDTYNSRRLHSRMQRASRRRRTH
jgi:hypothetical protein